MALAFRSRELRLGGEDDPVSPRRFLGKGLAWMSAQPARRSARSVLTISRISTQPTAAVGVFAVAQAFMLYAAVRYQINFGYLIAFWAITVTITTAWMSCLMLRGLEVEAGEEAAPTVCGGRVRFSFELRDRAGIHRKWLIVRVAGQEFEVDLPARGCVTIEFEAVASHRGIVNAPVVWIGTAHPMGLWNTHHLWLPAQAALVYPRAETNAPEAAGEGADGVAGGTAPGHEGVAGVRAYRQGDAPGRIAWKLYAKTDGQMLATKEGESSGSVQWIDESSAQSAGATEARVERLSAWIERAHRSGVRFGLRAFGQQIAPDQGDAHYHACMKVLALAPGYQVSIADDIEESEGATRS